MDKKSKERIVGVAKNQKVRSSANVATTPNVAVKTPMVDGVVKKKEDMVEEKKEVVKKEEDKKDILMEEVSMEEKEKEVKKEQEEVKKVEEGEVKKEKEDVVPPKIKEKSPPLLPPPPPPPKAITPTVAPKKKPFLLKQPMRIKELEDNSAYMNDHTEFLENAQLTKMMSNAEIRAALGGGANNLVENEDHSCQETVEEAASEMQDMVFGSLLIQIPIEIATPIIVVLPDENSRRTSAEPHKIRKSADPIIEPAVSEQKVVVLNKKE